MSTSGLTLCAQADLRLLRLGEDNVGELALDLLPGVRVHLRPEVSARLRDAFPELDGRELTDLGHTHSVSIIARSSR